MFRTIKQFSAVLAVLVSLAFVACEQTSDPVSELVVSAPEMTVVTTSWGQQAAVPAPPLPQGTDLEISELIGPAGGQIALAGYEVNIPAGAVDEPTLFSLGLSNDGQTRVAFSAAVEREGEFTNVETTPRFDEPVVLALRGGTKVNFTKWANATGNYVPGMPDFTKWANATG